MPALLRRLCISPAFALFAVLAWVSLTGAASAQAPNYPPSTTTSTSAPTSTTTAAEELDVRDFGAVREGEAFDKRDCGFAPGATATVAFGSQDAGTTSAGSDGCVVLRVEVRTGRSVAVNGRVFDGTCGENTITVRAPSPSGASRTATNRFTITCAPTVGASLTRTGAAILWPSAAGVALAFVGLALVVAARRRPTGR